MRFTVSILMLLVLLVPAPEMCIRDRPWPAFWQRRHWWLIELRPVN